MGLSLMPWEQSFGAVVIQVRFSDVLGMELFDNTLGEVVIPLAKLAGSGRAVEGWFRLLSVGTTDTIPGEESPDESAVELEGEESETESEEGEDSPAPVVAFPELYVNIKFSSNALGGGDGMSLSDDMESFKVICEEMSRTASIAQSNSIGVIGSSLNTINTVRSLGGKLQNQISVVVDMVERVRNAFNFSVSHIRSLSSLLVINSITKPRFLPSHTESSHHCLHLFVLVASLGSVGLHTHPYRYSSRRARPIWCYLLYEVYDAAYQKEDCKYR